MPKYDEREKNYRQLHGAQKVSASALQTSAQTKVTSQNQAKSASQSKSQEKVTTQEKVKSQEQAKAESESKSDQGAKSESESHTRRGTKSEKGVDHAKKILEDVFGDKDISIFDKLFDGSASVSVLSSGADNKIVAHG